MTPAHVTDNCQEMCVAGPERNPTPSPTIDVAPRVSAMESASCTSVTCACATRPLCRPDASVRGRMRGPRGLGNRDDRMWNGLEIITELPGHKGEDKLEKLQRSYG